MRRYQLCLLLLYLFPLISTSGCVSHGGAYGDRNYDLIAAAADGDEKKVRRLLSQGADVNAQELQLGMTPLIAATYKQSAKTVVVLLAAGAKADFRGQSNQTPLMIASQSGDMSTATALLRAGANKDLANDDGVTPLMLAAESGQLQTVRLLLDSGARPSEIDQKGWSALTYAESKKQAAVANLLRTRGAL